MGYIQPRVLASYDIVITTYETLGKIQYIGTETCTGTVPVHCI
jgi:hypothetical protein